MTIAERVNMTSVTKDDLFELSEASDEYSRMHPDREDDGMAGMYLAAQHCKNDPLKALAMWSRMSALSKLLSVEGARGWVLPNRAPDGGVFVQETLLAAAAVHPLVEQGNEFVFERESFLAKALELAKSEASG